MAEDDGTANDWSGKAADHVGSEHYAYLLRGAMLPGEMLQRIHRHVLAGCATCREGWEGLVSGQRRDLRDLLAGFDEPIPFDPTPPPSTPLTKPSPYESAFVRAGDEPGPRGAAPGGRPAARPPAARRAPGAPRG